MVLSNLDDKWSQDKINTAFLCICSNISTCKQETTQQPYNEINYCGYLADFSCTVECAPRIDTPLWGTNLSTSSTMCIGDINHNKTVIVDSTSVKKTQCETSYIFRNEYYETFPSISCLCCAYKSIDGCEYCSGICAEWSSGDAPYVEKYDNNTCINCFEHCVWSGTSAQQSCYNCCLDKYTGIWTCCVNYYSSYDYVCCLCDPSCNECLDYYLNCPPSSMYSNQICCSSCWINCTFYTSTAGTTITQYAVDEMFFLYQNCNLYNCDTNYYYPAFYNCYNTHLLCCCQIGTSWNPNSQYLASDMVCSKAYCPYTCVFTKCRYYGGRWCADTNWIYDVYPYDPTIYNTVDSITDKSCYYISNGPFLSTYRKTILTCVVVRCTCQSCSNDKWCINQRYI